MNIRLVLALCLALTGAVHAQDAYPNRPIRLIHPFTAGGSGDTVARTIAQKLGERLGQPIIVENRAGAGGLIGNQAVAQAEPDGYTLLMLTSAFAIDPAIYAKLPYDPIKSFTPIAYIASGANVIAVNPDVKANTLPELIALAKANPGKLHYGSPGSGTSQHLGAELFLSMARIDIGHVPYKGASQSMLDVMAGRVEVISNTVISALPHIRSGKLRPLGVSSSKRQHVLPDVPSISEVLPGYEGGAWFALGGPANLPPAIVKKLSEGVRDVVRDPALVKWFGDQAVDLEYGDSDALGKRIADDVTRWKKVAKDAGLKAQ